MKRDAETYLDRWFAGLNRKPLILRGARQVGKSTLVRNFARQKNMILYEINLEKKSVLEDVFKTLDLPHIMRELEAVLGEKIDPKKGILFLDEIQATPHAIQALRYFFEESPTLPVISAGSLLEFALEKSQFSMPVGRVQYFHLGPMTFEEFLLACGEEFLLDQLVNLSITSPVSMIAHEKLNRLLRDYLLVGGMPAAVAHYIQTKDDVETQRILRSIVETYSDDITKYTTQSSRLRVAKIFDLTALHVGKKVIYSHYTREYQARDVRSALETLSLARVLTFAHHTDCSGVPLRAGEDPYIYKVIMLDCGLWLQMLETDWKSLRKLDSAALVNEGVVMEQFIGQHLALRSADIGPRLHYWLREGKSNNAEVDFITTVEGKIVPIEVKAGKSGSLRSLHHLCALKHFKFAVRFDLNPISVQKIIADANIAGESVKTEYTLLSLPAYAVGQFDRFVTSAMATKID